MVRFVGATLEPRDFQRALPLSVFKPMFHKNIVQRVLSYVM
jgi:hypothetical protein